MRTHDESQHADILFSSYTEEKNIAIDLYQSVKNLPIVSPHGHIPVEWFAYEQNFENPTQLFITPDHYVTRMLHAQGIPLSTLGVKQSDFSDRQAKEAFVLLGKYWTCFAGTPMRYWFNDALHRVFGVTTCFDESSASYIYDEVNELLKLPEFTTRSLLQKFNIDFISTTDDPIDDLRLHDQVNADPSFHANLAPAFRPDRYLEPGVSEWASCVEALGRSAGLPIAHYDDFAEAMRIRRQYFKQHGAVLSDHSHIDTQTARLQSQEAETLFVRALHHDITAGDASRLRRHMLNDQARLAQEDGLVMTIHPAVHRNYDRRTFSEFGLDVGGDIPAQAEFALGLSPLLNEYGNNPNFHLVAFTMDESTYSRELAPLAGFYPSLYIGAPWWFIDSPESIARYYGAVVPYSGFTKMSGFVDDTRALCSVPSRHDMNRRLSSRYIASLVADKRISKEEGFDLVHFVTDTLPRKVFNIRNKSQTTGVEQ